MLDELAGGGLLVAVLVPGERDRPRFDIGPEEHADLWLGFSADEIAGFFADARLQRYGYALLGMQ